MRRPGFPRMPFQRPGRHPSRLMPRGLSNCRLLQGRHAACILVEYVEKATDNRPSKVAFCVVAVRCLPAIRPVSHQSGHPTSVLWERNDSDVGWPLLAVARNLEPVLKRHKRKGSELMSKTLVLAASTAVALGSIMTTGFAADVLTKAQPSLVGPPASAVVSPWDIAFGAAIMSDYNFRGITQSNHKPSVAAYFEPRYNFNDSWQGYLGLSGESISFPNRAAAEIDFYGGIRPTFGKLALDFGAWYYWYPGGTCFNGFILGECRDNADPVTFGLPINGNVIKSDLSFWEIYAKGTYTVNDQFSFGGSVYWSPSVLNSGAAGTYLAGTAKYVLPAVLPGGIGWFISADVGHWFLGSTDGFYCVPAASGVLPAGCSGILSGGVNYKSYTNWDIGVAFTWKQFTLDLRYFDTDLNKGDCNAFTSAQNARFDGSFTAINPGGFGTNWCSATFIAKLSVDLTKDNLK
jgi:uncharacterized protein (TIGR02001 family)